MIGLLKEGFLAMVDPCSPQLPVAKFTQQA
jgi:hypothetical protein